MSKTCFLALDFADAKSEKVIAPVLVAKGYKCIRTDRTGERGSFLSEVVRTLGTADVVVADITNHNPNVLYELGLAHALRRETIVIKRVADRDELGLPADLSQYKVIGYQDTIEGADQLRTALEAALGTVRPGSSTYLEADFEFVESQIGTAERIEETLTRVFTNASHPLTAILLAPEDGKHVGRVRAASSDANRFYGYAPADRTLIGSDLGVLLGRLKNWMDADDFKAFEDEQTKISQAAASGVPSFATVPIRLNQSHPRSELRGRAFLPMVLGITDPIGERPVTYTIILYLDVGGFLENLMAEYALPASLRTEAELRARSQGIRLSEFLSRLIQRSLIGAAARA
jgi:hypothetical protein